MYLTKIRKNLINLQKVINFHGVFFILYDSF